MISEKMVKKNYEGFGVGNNQMNYFTEFDLYINII